MPRLTKVTNNGIYFLDNNYITLTDNIYTGEAVEKLAKFENLSEELEAEQAEISKELEKLRNENKMHSYKFKELMGRKLINGNTLTLLKNKNLT